MRKTMKAIVSLLLACLLIFGGTTMAFAEADLSGLNDSIGSSVFMSFSDFVEKNGIKGAFIYPIYITLIAPIAYLLTIVGVGVPAAIIAGLADEVAK